MSTEITNFDELAKDTEFTLKGVKYVIPAITNEKAVALFDIGKKLGKKEKDLTLFDTDNIAEKEEEEDKGNTDFINEQNEFICLAVVREDGEKMTPDFVHKNWPMKVSIAVVKLINKCISGIDEDTPEEKK